MTDLPGAGEGRKRVNVIELDWVSDQGKTTSVDWRTYIDSRHSCEVKREAVPLVVLEVVVLPVRALHLKGLGRRCAVVRAVDRLCWCCLA